MTGYRGRGMKPTMFLWMLIVVADAGWSVASGLTALVTTVAVGVVAVLLLLIGRQLRPGAFAARQPVPVRAPIPARRPVRMPASVSVDRRGYAVPRLSVRHHTS